MRYSAGGRASGGFPERLQGVVIVLDDCGFNGHEARHGIDAPGKELGFLVWPPQTGQGVIPKW